MKPVFYTDVDRISQASTYLKRIVNISVPDELSDELQKVAQEIQDLKFKLIDHFKTLNYEK